MVRLIGKRSDARGFTLVELLIVIAIIGVLSTVGIPAFKRMIQKSKKTEAKTSLGALYTAEQAFFSEYGGYGNNLRSIGFSVDGSGNGGGAAGVSATTFYDVGFPGGATCASAPPAISPVATDNIGIAVTSAFPAYYAGGAIIYTTKLPAPYLYGGNLTSNGLNKECYNLLPVYLLRDGSSLLNFGINSYTPTGGTLGVDNGYIASASGVITPSAARTSGTPADYDFWTIDHERTIKNVQDGVR